jgi:hypothetical protein
MEFLSKIADAFDPANAAKAMTSVMQKVSDGVADLTGSPKMNLSKINLQQQNQQPLQPKMQSPISNPVPVKETKGQKEEETEEDKNKKEEVLSNPKYREQVEAFKKDKKDYDSVVAEMNKMEKARFSHYKNLYDVLHGNIMDHSILIDINYKIKEQNTLFEKYTKLSELYWKLLGHPIYGKLIPVTFPKEAGVEHKGYYYTANGIVYDENKKTTLVDPYVMYFTYFYKVRDAKSMPMPKPEPMPMPKPEPMSMPKPEPMSMPNPEPMPMPKPEPMPKPAPPPMPKPAPAPVPIENEDDGLELKEKFEEEKVDEIVDEEGEMDENNEEDELDDVLLEQKKDLDSKDNIRNLRKDYADEIM